MASRAGAQMSLWWLSFVDDGRNLGIAIVEAADSAAAIKTAWALGCNPGGEVFTMEIDDAVLARLSFALPVERLVETTEAVALADRITAELGS